MLFPVAAFIISHFLYNYLNSPGAISIRIDKIHTRLVFDSLVSTIEFLKLVISLDVQDLRSFIIISASIKIVTIFRRNILW